MKHSLLIGALAVCSLTVGCGKKDGDAPSKGSAAAAPATPGGCAAGQTLLEGPRICVTTPEGFVKPLDQSNSKDPTGGNFNVSYSSDGKSGGKFVATFTVTYNAAPASPVNWSYFEKDAADLCDAPPTMEDIAGGKGKYYQCPSKKLDGHVLNKSKTATGKNLIDCQGQSDKKPEVDTVCKTLLQL